MFLGIILPLFIIVVAILGMVNMARRFGKIGRMSSKGMSRLSLDFQKMEARVNKSAAMVCGSYVILLVPVFFIMAVDPMPPRFGGQFKIHLIDYFCASRESI